MKLIFEKSVPGRRCSILPRCDVEEVQLPQELRRQEAPALTLAEGVAMVQSLRQHGLPTLKIADLACDMQLLEEAQSAARALLCRDEDLSRPEHRPLLERVRELFHDAADSMN